MEKGDIEEGVVKKWNLRGCHGLSKCFMILLFNFYFFLVILLMRISCPPFYSVLISNKKFTGCLCISALQFGNLISLLMFKCLYPSSSLCAWKIYINDLMLEEYHMLVYPLLDSLCAEEMPNLYFWFCIITWIHFYGFDSCKSLDSDVVLLYPFWSILKSFCHNLFLCCPSISLCISLTLFLPHHSIGTNCLIPISNFGLIWLRV